MLADLFVKAPVVEIYVIQKFGGQQRDLHVRLRYLPTALSIYDALLSRLLAVSKTRAEMIQGRDSSVQRPNSNWCMAKNEVTMRNELLDEALFLSMAHVQVEIAAWGEGYNQERPHSSLGYATPAAFAAELDKQWPASLRPTGSATQPIASTALMRKTTARL